MNVNFKKNILFFLQAVVVFGFVLFSQISLATEIFIPLQFKLKNPAGSYPSTSGVSVKIQVMTPTGSCILREETFSGLQINEGQLSVVLGSGSRGSNDPALTLGQVYDNYTAKTNLKCVDASGAVTATGQTFNPTPAHSRKLRITALVSTDTIVANLDMRSVPYAKSAESIGGKVATDFLLVNSSTQLNQANLENLLADATKLSNLLNIANSGLAAVATNATNATTAQTATTAGNFTGTLSGDVTGTQSSTSVTKLQGFAISNTAPVSGQVLVYNGSAYVPTNYVVNAVTSVNGQTGAVVLTATDVGALASATVFSGDVSGMYNSLVVDSIGGKLAADVSASVDKTMNAASLATPNTLVQRDGSGNASFSTLTSVNNSTKNIYLYNTSGSNSIRLMAPNSLADFSLTLPSDAGTNGYLLTSDGTGNLVWSAPNTNAGTVTQVSSFNNYITVGNATSAVTLTLNVGSTPNTVAAGDDSRITGALQSTVFNGYVASASCSATQTMYWNSVSSSFMCMNIAVSGDVSGVASATTVQKIKNINLNFTSLANNDLLQFNGTEFVNRTIPTCSVGTSLSFNGSAWSCVSSAGFSVNSANAYITVSNAGSSATITARVGTTSNTLAAGDDARIIGALQKTTDNLAGDVSGLYNAVSVNKIKGVSVTVTALANNDLLQYNGTQYVNRTIPTCSAGQYLTFNGTAWACTTPSGASSSVTSLTVSSPLVTNATSGAVSLSLSSSGVTSGTYGSATSATVISVDAFGRITAASSVGITPAFSAITNKPTTLAGYGITDGMSSALANGKIWIGNATGSATAVTVAGDFTLTNTGSGTLANTGVTAGTYGSVSGIAVLALDAKGRVTSASNVNYQDATATQKGVVQIGSNITVTTGTISITNANVTAALGYTPTNSASMTSYVLKTDVPACSAGTYLTYSGTTWSCVAALQNSLPSAQFYLGNAAGSATATTLSGDATLSNTGVLTLKNTGTAATYGATDKSLFITTDAQGRVVSATPVSIAIQSTQMTDFASGVRGVVLTGLTTATSAAVTATDSVLAALGKLQAQVSTTTNFTTTKIAESTSNTTQTATMALVPNFTLTPPAGTYQVVFTSSVSSSTNGSAVTMAIFAGGVQLPEAVVTTTPRNTVGVNSLSLTIPIMLSAEVTVNGAQAIELRWSATTANSITLGPRNFMIRRVR